METDGYIDTFGQPVIDYGNKYARNLGFNRENAFPDHYASPNQQPLAGILGATATRDHYIPNWSPNFSPSNYGFQQQFTSTAYTGSNIEWTPYVSISAPAWDPASQRIAQSLNSVTPCFDQAFIPSLSSADYPLAQSNAIANGQPDPALQLLSLGVYDDLEVMSNDLANVNSFTQWDNLTTIDAQATMSCLNQLPVPITASMSTAPALNTNAPSMHSNPAVSSPVARRVPSHRSNANMTPHVCDNPGCSMTFNRLGDLVRHRQQHGNPQYPCLVHGCKRRGRKAFYRTDKLRDHQRKKHRMAI